MLLSKRGKRRLLVLVVGGVLVAAGFALLHFVRQAQQSRLIAQARSAGLDAYRRGDLQIALNQLSYYFEHRKDDLEVNMVFAEARSRLPIVGGRHLFEAVDLYDAHALDLIDQRGGHAAERREVLLRLLNLYAQLGDRGEVEDTADALLRIDPVMIEALAAKGEVAFLGRRFDDAEAVAARLMEIEPDNLAWRKMILEARARNGATSEMLVEQCRQWAQAYAGDARFRLLTAATLVEGGRTDEARDELRSVAQLSANSRGVLEQIVSLMDTLGLHAEADAALRTSRERFASEWWPREAAIRRHWHDGRLDAALAEITQAMADLGELPTPVRRLQVATLLAAGRADEALVALEPILRSSTAQKELDSDRTWAAAIASVLQRGKSNWAASMTSLQAALGVSPRDPVLHSQMGDACMAVGETASALYAYEQAYAAAPNWTAAGVTYGEALLSLGRLDDAYRIARTVASRSGFDRVQPFLLFARSFVALREAGVPVSGLPGGDVTADLLQAVGDLHAQQPDDVETASVLARLHLAAGDPRSASDICRQALARETASAEMLISLADVSSAGGLDLEEQLLQRAGEMASDSLPVALRRANALAALGQSVDGLRAIDNAIAAAKPEGDDFITAKCVRTDYLLRVGDAGALPALADLVLAHEDSAVVQRFALAQPAAWSDQRLIAQAMRNLRRLLGEGAIQVRLAEANFLIQHHGREKDMLAKAIVTINGVLHEAPDSLAALSLAAEALVLGEPSSLPTAQAHLERAAGLYPSEPSVVVRLIALLQRQGRFDDARRYLQALAQMLRTHPEFAREEMRLLEAQGDFETALVRASAIVDATSPPPEQLLLAAMEERTGRRDQAEDTYARLLVAHPQDALVLSQAAEFYASTGRFARGLDLIQQIPAIPDGPSQGLLIGVFHQRHGRTAEAGTWLRAAVEKAPKADAARNELARHYLSVGEAAKARDEALAGLRDHPDNTALRGTLAIANLALPDADRGEAIRLLREIGSGNEDLLAMLELLARVPAQSGRAAPTPENLADARRLTEAHAFFMPIWQLAVSLHVEAGRRNDAISIARSAVGRLPGQPLPSEWATALLMQANRWDEALAEALEWRRRTLGDPIAAECSAARILLALERAPEAAALITPRSPQIMEERAAFSDRVAVLVEALVRGGEPARAAELMQPLLEEHPRWLRLWMGTAASMEPNEAERVLASLEPLVTEPVDRLALAAQWLTLARRTSSEAHLERAAMSVQPLGDEVSLKAETSVILGAVAEARGDFAAAERHYRAAVEASPQHAIALNNLAYALVMLGRHADALPLIERAIANDPEHPDFLDTHASVLLGLGRADDAVRELERALALRPEEPAFLLNLAAAHLALNQPADAADILNRLERRSTTLNQRQRARVAELRGQVSAAENDAAAASASKPGVP